MEKLFLLVVSCALILQGTAMPEQRVQKSPSDLRRDLFKNYDQKSIPVKNWKDSITTKVGLSLLSIRELMDMQQILLTDTWFYMAWQDQYLTWDPAAYGGIESINIPSEEVWKPDITTYTMTPGENLLPKALTNVIVNYTGDVLWVPPVTIRSRCHLELSNFPHDVQKCMIKLGSWTFSQENVNLQLYGSDIDMTDFTNNHQRWDVIATAAARRDAYYPCCPGVNYPSLEFNITMRRRPDPDIFAADTVSAFAVFLSVLMFWLPSDCAQKFVVGSLALVVLGTVPFYIGVAIDAPYEIIKGTERVYPFMCVVAGALIVEVLILNLSRLKGPCRPPRFLVSMASACCHPLCLCVSRSGDPASEMMLTDKSKTPMLSAHEEWNLVATALDRGLFVLYLVICFSLYYFHIY